MPQLKGPLYQMEPETRTESHPEGRSRSLAQQTKYNHKLENICAATPPLESQKLLSSMAATAGIGMKPGGRKKQ